MKLNSVSVNDAIKQVEDLIEKEKSISPALKAAIKILVTLMTIIIGRLNINSKNSSKPPSEDKDRKRGSNRKKSEKKPAGQDGHIGARLKKSNYSELLK